MKSIRGIEKMLARDAIKMCAEIMPKLRILHTKCEALTNEYGWDDILYEDIALSAMHVGCASSVLSQNLLEINDEDEDELEGGK